MPKMKLSFTDEELFELRTRFRSDIEAGKLNFSQSLKRMRQIAGMPQKEFSEMMGVGYRTIVDMERGCGNPRVSTLNKIGRVFGLEVKYSLKFTEK